MYDTARWVAFVKQRVRGQTAAWGIRLRNRENQKKGGADKPNRHEQEKKSQ